MKWGIIGPGNIARKFAEGMKVVKDAELYAVASRSSSRAEAFGKKYNIPLERCFGSYEELVSNTEVEVIYIAVPHSLHKELSIMCLEAGKAVLCEKPVALNREETEQIINCAEKKKIFFMEAMWTRFLPAIQTVRKWIDEGKIGNIQMLESDFGFRSEFNPEIRLFNPSLGGGALLDVGIYTISIASYLFGQNPEKIHSFASIGKSGVDEQSVSAFQYKNGTLASLTSSIVTETPQCTNIMGTEGRISIPDFWKAEKAVIHRNGIEEKVHMPFTGNGYEYEIIEVMNCIKKGKLQSSIMSWEESLQVMETMDCVRRQWNISRR